MNQWFNHQSLHCQLHVAACRNHPQKKNGHHWSKYKYTQMLQKYLHTFAYIHSFGHHILWGKRNQVSTKEPKIKKKCIAPYNLFYYHHDLKELTLCDNKLRHKNINKNCAISTKKSPNSRNVKI